jgi:hypothetical protein
MDIHTDNIETMITVKTDILSAIKGQIMSVESTEDIGKAKYVKSASFGFLRSSS